MDYSDEKIAALIDGRISTGLGAENKELSASRQEIMDRYFGELYGTEVSGQSKATTREVLEAVEWTMPSLMRIFAADDQVVIFEAEGPEDEAAAKQETAYVNYVFKRENEGFIVLYDFCKDTLLNPTAYVKCWYEHEEISKTLIFEGLTLPEVTQISGEYNIVESTENEDGTFDIKIRNTNITGRVKVQCVPPNELTIDEKLTSWNVEEGDFINHRRNLSASDLVEMGFDKDMALEAINKATENANDEAQNTTQYEDENDDGEENDRWTQKAAVDETYIKLDVNGDGLAEWRKVTKAGSFVLEHEEAEYMPYISMSAIRIPHRHIGLAWAELVKDIQKIKTALTRQMLNNLYRVNNPRPIIGPGVNMADVLNDIPNAPIRANRVENFRIEPTAPVINQVIPALQLFDEYKESRIGVSRNTMGLDADTLAESTRGAFFGAMEQANQRLELLARLFAETGIKKIFLKIHELLLKFQDKEKVVKLTGQWVPVNPLEWKERTNMTCVVGIGFGTKDQQLMALEQIFNKQKEIIAGGGGEIVTPQNIYNTMSKAIELANLGDPNKYITDPSKVPPKPKEPSIEELMYQVEVMNHELKKMVETKKAEQKDRELKLKEEQATTDVIRDMTKLEIEAGKDLGPEGRMH